MIARPDPKKSDLGIRAVSAFVMLVVAGAALWLGGWWWTIFVLLVGAGVWFEWSTLVLLFTPPGARRAIWRYAGAVYCGIAAAMLLTLRDQPDGIFWVLLFIGAVIGTDVGAYTLGRLVGGPKIAPKVSPSKTWAGLLGGMAGAGLCVLLIGSWHEAYLLENEAVLDFRPDAAWAISIGSALAIIAQAGDFFESWMKRRAGVKDSGKLIPGHGGLFDRVDGLLAVLFVTGILFLVVRLTFAT